MIMIFKLGLRSQTSDNPCLVMYRNVFNQQQWSAGQLFGFDPCDTYAYAGKMTPYNPMLYTVELFFFRASNM